MTLVNRFGQYILRSRKNAIMMALVCALLPFLSVLSFIIVALVTLRKGVAEGFLVLLWAILPEAVFLFSSIFPVAAVLALGSGVLVWILASLLRRFSNWQILLEMMAVFGVIIVLIIHLHPGIHALWMTYLSKFYEQAAALNISNITEADLKQFLSSFQVGFLVAMNLSASLVELILARAWVASLFPAEKQSHAWFNIRLSYRDVIVLLVMGAMAFWHILVFRDVLLVILLPFIVAGISLIHGVLIQRKTARQTLLLFYTGLALVWTIFPALLSLFTIVAIIDSIWNLRARLIA